MSRFIKLPNPGIGLTQTIRNLIFGVNHDGSDFEYKRLVGSGNVVITETPGQIKIHGSGGGEGGGAPVWGDITGTLSDQADLQTALDANATAASNAQATADSADGKGTQALLDAATAQAGADAAQAAADAAQSDATTALANAASAAGTATWGGIGGTIASQVDLKAITDAIQADIDAIEEANGVTDLRDGSWVTPEEYGAVGDGVTDDSAAVLAAVATGKHVQLDRSKTYLMTRNIKLQEGQTFAGNNATMLRNGQKSTTTNTTIEAGVTTTITLADASDFVVGDMIVVEQGGTYMTNGRSITAINGNDVTVSPPLQTSFTGTSNVYTAWHFIDCATNGRNRIRDVKFDADRSQWTFCRWELLDTIILRGTHCVVENCTITNQPGEGVVQFGSHHRVTGCYMETLNGNGVHFSLGDHCVVDDCTIIETNLDTNMGHQEGCITWSSFCKYMTVTNCWLQNGLRGCGGMSETSESVCRIVGNVIKDCENQGINQYVDVGGELGSSDSVYIGNLIEGCGTGIGMAGPASTPTALGGYLNRVICSNNNIIGCTNSGIDVRGALHCVVSNNTIDHNGGSFDGITATNCFRSVFTGNTIHGGNRGINITTCTDCTFNNNVCYGQVSNGIFYTVLTAGGANNTAAFNHVGNADANSANGYMGLTACDRLRVIGNNVRITNNGGALTAVRGIQVYSTAYQSSQGGGGTVCEFNTVVGTGQYGIRIDGGTGKAVIRFNNITPTTILSQGGGIHTGTVATATFAGTVTDGQIGTGTGQVTITSGGTGYISAGGSIVATFIQGSNTSAFGVATAVNGVITTVTVSAPGQGSGYSTPGTPITIVFGGNVILYNNIIGVGANEDPLQTTPNLAAFNALVGVADRLPYFNGTGTMALATISNAGRNLLSPASTEFQRQVLAVSANYQAITATPGTTVALTITTGGMASWTAAQDETINLTGTQVDGKQLMLRILNDATPRTITFGTGFTTGTAQLVGQASKKAILVFVSNGTTFDEVSRKEGIG